MLPLELLLVGFLAATSTLCSPLDLTSPQQVLTANARLEQPQRWNDEHIAEPQNFTATHISGCDYMLTFYRDAADSRYTLQYQVRHGVLLHLLPELTSRHAFPLGPLATHGAYAPRALWAVHLRDACSAGASGAPPSSFRVFFDLEQAFANRNSWWSEPVELTPVTSTPAAPAEVSARRNSVNGDTVTVSWTPVAGATGYYVKHEAPVGADSGSISAYELTVVEGGSASSALIHRPGMTRATVLSRGAEGVVSGFAEAQVVTVT